MAVDAAAVVMGAAADAAAVVMGAAEDAAAIVAATAAIVAATAGAATKGTATAMRMKTDRKCAKTLYVTRMAPGHSGTARAVSQSDRPRPRKTCMTDRKALQSYCHIYIIEKWYFERLMHR